MKKSRESSHYFSRQYPRRRQIRLPARLQISGTMTMPQGSSRWEHTMGAALCSGHGRRRLHVRQRQNPRSAGETSRAVFSSAPIAVFLIQKEKILETIEISRIFSGAAGQIRTADLVITNDALYRLSYSSRLSFSRALRYYSIKSGFVKCCFHFFRRAVFRGKCRLPCGVREIGANVHNSFSPRS